MQLISGIFHHIYAAHWFADFAQIEYFLITSHFSAIYWPIVKIFVPKSMYIFWVKVVNWYNFSFGALFLSEIFDWKVAFFTSSPKQKHQYFLPGHTSNSVFTDIFGKCPFNDESSNDATDFFNFQFSNFDKFCKLG